MHKTRNRIVVAIALAASVAGVSTLLSACSNSFLRNLTEAGAESALDDPLPTPTRAPR